MVRPSKRPRAHLAGEGFGSGVFAEMSGQFVTAGETPLAGGECALVGLFACVDALMGLQVGGLGVGFATSRIVTEVDSSLLQLGVVLSVVFDGGASGMGLRLLAGLLWSG